MLSLSRREGEAIVIGTGANRITITVVEIFQGKIKLGIDAPREIKIDREECLDRDVVAEFKRKQES